VLIVAILSVGVVLGVVTSKGPQSSLQGDIVKTVTEEDPAERTITDEEEIIDEREEEIVDESEEETETDTFASTDGSGAVCGNGRCEIPGESADICPQDCKGADLPRPDDMSDITDLFNSGDSNNTRDVSDDTADDTATSDVTSPNFPDPNTPILGPCGNGVVNYGETCDDNNTVDGDGCSASCQVEFGNLPRLGCGDGICSKVSGENAENCAADCSIDFPFDIPGRTLDGICGNGDVEPGEQCDDGDNEDGDGCSSSCVVESEDDVDSTTGSNRGGGGNSGFRDALIAANEDGVENEEGDSDDSANSGEDESAQAPNYEYIEHNDPAEEGLMDADSFNNTIAAVAEDGQANVLSETGPAENALIAFSLALMTAGLLMRKRLLKD